MKARILLGGLAVAAAGLAYHFGGGGEARSPLPEPTADAAAPAAPGAAEAEEIALRLVDAVSDARVSAPNLDRGAALLALHWRKMPLAFHELSAQGKKLTTSIALRTSETEVQWSVPTSSGKNWTPDARVWNMSEGSFDQREAIFAPTPSTLTFRVAVPPKAKLVFSPGTANPDGDATIFSVSVKDAHGQRSTPYEKRFLPEQTSSWIDDESVDLGAWAGQTVDLELATRADPRTADEPAKARGRSPRPPRDADGGPPAPPPADTTSAPGMSLALWGNPEIRARRQPRLPYNVLFIVVDALRPDVIPSFHDDAEDEKKLGAQYPPLEALLPKVAGVTPNLDALAARGVRFTHAYSGGAWTRPGTVAMLSGERSTELGLDPLPWVLPQPMAAAYYRSDPPMLPLLLRRQGDVTRAFVNNYFMIGYAPVGVDMGFERVDDHRYRTKDTAEITAHAVAWLKQNKDARFFAFCNYNSPHEPLEPPQRFLDRIPAPKSGGLAEDMVRRYMAEADKDDEAIGVLLKTLDDLGLRDNTIVVVTADHGETMSADHAGTSKLDHMPVRWHHAVSNYEETTRIPIIMSLPGVLPENAVVKDRIRNVDIAPTLLELLGQEKNPKMSGASVLPLVRGQKEADERVVLSEGRGTRGLIAGHWRAIFREGAAQTTIYPSHPPGGEDRTVTIAEELYDLDSDPGERRNVAHAHPDVMAEMRARLAAARKNVPVAGTAASLLANTLPATVATSRAATATSGPPRLQVRFSGAGAAHRVTGHFVFSFAKDPPPSLRWDLAGLPADAVKSTRAGTLDIALVTAADQPVGFDVTATPPGADVRWELFLDDGAWPQGAVFAGPFGLFDARVAAGLASEEAREDAFARTLPEIDPSRDLGMFVVREQASAYDTSDDLRASPNSGAAQEMDRLLHEWGYAHGPSKP
ncbi:MAG TPA: sulfatase [Polyangiaceae bacterium]|nr:sulfatase [Polyangiaceae bacterium]